MLKVWGIRDIKNIKISSEKLIVVCLAVAVLGTIALYFYSLALQPKEIQISEILVTPAGQYIKVSGIVKSIELGTSFSKLNVCDVIESSACVSVRFGTDLLPGIYNINENDTVTVRGLVQEYFKNKYLEVKNEGDIIKVA